MIILKLASALLGLLILILAVALRLRWYEEERGRIHMWFHYSNPKGDTQRIGPTSFWIWLLRFILTFCLLSLAFSCMLYALTLFVHVPGIWHLYVGLGGALLLFLVVKWWSVKHDY